VSVTFEIDQVFPTQDPKYGIKITPNGPKLCNMASGEVIPDNEPIMTFRAKDKKFLPHLHGYWADCSNQEHYRAVREQILRFEEFRKQHPELMKEPDTEQGK
jgi:hypothetical protein